MVKATVDDVSEAGADRAAPPPVVILIASGAGIERRVFAASERVVLGRQVVTGGASVAIDDERMSRAHAEVMRRGDTWRIRDLDSRNGSFVDGVRIDGEITVRGDAVVRLGQSIFLLIADGRGHDQPPRDDADAVIGPELGRAFDQIRAHADSPGLLIHGESGAGKELAARLWHDAGPRASGPFVAINCATIPAGVAERVLFGARKGAFSGATADVAGLVQAAHGGTLFLDEIAELDPAVQAKLLRVLETREVIPIGATAGVHVEAGVVAASHRALRTAVAAGRFRDDLYYRLARALVALPPLRQRRADLPRLIARALAAEGPSLRAHPRLVETVCLRPWPGNVRELQHALADAVVTARGAGRTVIREDDLPPDAGLPIGAEPAAPPASPPSDPVTPTPAPRSPGASREAIDAAIAAAGGNLSAAARALGLHRTQLYRLLQRAGRADDDRDPDPEPQG